MSSAPALSSTRLDCRRLLNNLLVCKVVDLFPETRYNRGMTNKNTSTIMDYFFYIPELIGAAVEAVLVKISTLLEGKLEWM